MEEINYADLIKNSSCDEIANKYKEVIKEALKKIDSITSQDSVFQKISDECKSKFKEKESNFLELINLIKYLQDEINKKNEKIEKIKKENEKEEKEKKEERKELEKKINYLNKNIIDNKLKSDLIDNQIALSTLESPGKQLNISDLEESCNKIENALTSLKNYDSLQKEFEPIHMMISIQLKNESVLIEELNKLEKSLLIFEKSKQIESEKCNEMFFKVFLKFLSLKKSLEKEKKKIFSENKSFSNY